MPEHGADRKESTRDFDDFVRKVEAKMTPEEREELDAWREHFRRAIGGEDPPAVREPA